MPVNIVANRKLDFGRIIVVVSLSKEGRVFCIKKQMIKNHPVQLDNIEVPVVQKQGYPADYFWIKTLLFDRQLFPNRFPILARDFKVINAAGHYWQLQIKGFGESR